jgi:hypothetical protein
MSEIKVPVLKQNIFVNFLQAISMWLEFLRKLFLWQTKGVDNRLATGF